MTFEVALLAPFLDAPSGSIERECRYWGPGNPEFNCCRWGLDVTLACHGCGARAAQLQSGDPGIWYEMVDHRSLVVEGDTSGSWHHQALWAPHRCPAATGKSLP